MINKELSQSRLTSTDLRNFTKDTTSSPLYYINTRKVNIFKEANSALSNQYENLVKLRTFDKPLLESKNKHFDTFHLKER